MVVASFLSINILVKNYTMKCCLQITDYFSFPVMKLLKYFILATRRTYHRTLIDDVNKDPKNYTIIYKYLGAKYKEVAYLEIDVNVSCLKNSRIH